MRLRYIYLILRLFERLCWAVAVVAFAFCASIMIFQAVDDWIETPGETKIETFSKVGRHRPLESE